MKGRRGLQLSQLSASSSLGFCKCPAVREKKKASGHLAETGKDTALPQLSSPFLHRSKERHALAGADMLQLD